MTVKKISISMDRDLYARLRAAADQQKRTFSNFICHIAETMLPAYESSQIRPKPRRRTKRT